jgi:hypothetical protein
MWTAWKLLVPLLVITVLPLWWWTWRVEGLLVFHLLLLLIVGILMSLIGGTAVSKASTRSMIPAIEHLTRSRVVSVDC